MAAEPDAPVGEFSCVLVPGDAPGLTWVGGWDGIGMRGNSSRRVQLSDVRVGPDHLLGSPGDQIWYVFEVIAPYFLMAMAGTYLGIAQSAVSRHLSQLERAGLVRVEPRRGMKYYAIDKPQLARLAESIMMRAR